MLALILTVCLAGEPSVCKQVRLPLAPASGLEQCLWAGQVQLVHWSEANPDWRIKRWTCGLPTV